MRGDLLISLEHLLNRLRSEAAYNWFMLAARQQQTEIRYNPNWSSQPRAPAGNLNGGQWIGQLPDASTESGGNRQDVAATRCDGLSGGCQTGGSYGTSGMFIIGGKRLCWDCAVRYLGIQDLPHEEQLNTLRLFDRDYK